MNKEITYKFDVIPPMELIIELYNGSGIIRPTSDPYRIEKMYANSNLVISAWEGERLIGISRSLTDFAHCCYLADLVVKKDFQKKGIGKALISLIKQKTGPQTNLILLSAPGAMEYYPKTGFRKVENGFIIDREE